MSDETIPADVVELVAKTIHDHWQGAPGLSARPWDGEKGTCTKLPAQAEDFRRKARAAMEALATRPAEPAAPVAEAGGGECPDCGSPLNSDGECTLDLAVQEADDFAEAQHQIARLTWEKEAERARADAAEQRAADALARAEKAEGAQGALVDLADWLENDCGAELPHSHIEKQVAIARGAPPRAERAERGLNVDATMALIEGALKWAVWCVGEGIMAIESEGVAAPEDFLMTYSDATGEEDWETLHERLPALLRASREAQLATDGDGNG